MSEQEIDVIVLTGFLGSGKTTLLRDLLATPAASDTAVIVNEVGEIGLDGALLAETGNGVPMAMLANGCICCRMGSDLADTVGALIEAKRAQAGSVAVGPRRIILETSGLSKPGPILRQLADLAGLRLRVAVVATYDAARGGAMAEFEEAAAQWAAAHRVVLTKLDAVQPDRMTAATREAAAVNPLADVVADADRARAVQAAFSPLRAAHSAPTAPRIADASAHPRIAVRLITPALAPSQEQLATWLDNLAGTLGERLLRLKGLVRVSGSDLPVLVQSVGTMFAAPRPFGRPGERHAPFLVVIARDLRPRELEAVQPADLFIVMR